MEKQFIENIRRNKLIIPKNETTEREFNYYLEHEALVNYFDSEDKVENFLRHNTIRMLMAHERPSKIEINELRNSEFWHQYQNIICEDQVGNPNGNGNLIHHTYSLNQLLKVNTIIFDNVHSIFEFGGGYGSFARIIKKIGFMGSIHLYDLPFFSELQRYFLSKIGISDNVNFYSNELKGDIKVDLFIGLWSFSEVSIEVRSKILESVSFDNCLIAYQPKCNGIDNEEYFKNMRENNKHIVWTDYAVAHLKSRYLIGIKK
jgi:hypothetical protein